MDEIIHIDNEFYKILCFLPIEYLENNNLFLENTVKNIKFFAILNRFFHGQYRIEYVGDGYDLYGTKNVIYIFNYIKRDFVNNNILIDTNMSNFFSAFSTNFSINLGSKKDNDPEFKRKMNLIIKYFETKMNFYVIYEETIIKKRSKILNYRILEGYFKVYIHDIPPNKNNKILIKEFIIMLTITKTNMNKMNEICDIIIDELKKIFGEL